MTHTNSSQLDKQKKRDFLPKGKSGREAMKWHIAFHNETIINENDELENKSSCQPYHLLRLTTTYSLQSSKPLQPFTPFLVKSSKCTPVSAPPLILHSQTINTNIICDWTSVKSCSYFFYFSVFLLLIVKH